MYWLFRMILIILSIHDSWNKSLSLRSKCGNKVMRQDINAPKICYINEIKKLFLRVCENNYCNFYYKFWFKKIKIEQEVLKSKALKYWIYFLEYLCL